MENKLDINQEQLMLAQEEDTMRDMYLVFTIDGQDYALEIRYVIEIVEIMPITSVPFLPECMKGIINLRGTIVPIMDVRLRFGLQEEAYTDHTCIVVVNQGNLTLGMIVDSVQEVTTFGEQQRMAPPSSGTGDATYYIKGVCNTNDNIRLLLDCEKLMEIAGKDR